MIINAEHTAKQFASGNPVPEAVFLEYHQNEVTFFGTFPMCKILYIVL